MHTQAVYAGAQRSLSGGLIVSFEIDDSKGNIEMINQLKDSNLILDVSKFRDKRSDRANRYCWKLCDLIAQALLSDKDTIYLMKLKQYGVFEDWEIPVDAIPKWKHLFRTCEPQYYFNSDGLDMVGLRCYRGSHTYNTKEMSVLINGIVSDAKDIGVETWTPAEIESALTAWKPRGEE